MLICIIMRILYQILRFKPVLEDSNQFCKVIWNKSNLEFNSHGLCLIWFNELLENVSKIFMLQSVLWLFRRHHHWYRMVEWLLKLTGERVGSHSVCWILCNFYICMQFWLRLCLFLILEGLALDIASHKRPETLHYLFTFDVRQSRAVVVRPVWIDLKSHERRKFNIPRILNTTWDSYKRVNAPV